MNKTLKKADEAVLAFTYPMGEYNAEMEIKAVEDGLMIDEYNVMPWDWILEEFLKQRLTTEGDGIKRNIDLIPR